MVERLVMVFRRCSGTAGRFRGRGGQTLVEYLLATLMLTMACAGLYGVLGNGVKGVFQKVAKVIVTETK